MNPYETLGVRKNASKAAIKNAYRMRSKTAHPDGGGSPEKFGEINLAYKVLSDDGKRERYDRTGEIDEGNPDNTEATIWNLIASMLEQIIMGDADPVQSDLIGGMQGAINKQIEAIQQMNAKLERARGRIVTVAQRFKIKKGENRIAMILNARLLTIEQAIAGNKKAIEINREAYRRLGQYTFERMVQQVQSHQNFGSFMRQNYTSTGSGSW